MSQVNLTAPQLDLLATRLELSESEQDMWDAITGKGGVMELMWSRLSRLKDAYNNEVGFGNPDNGDGTALHDNIDGQWVTVTLTSTAQLSSSAAVTVTHNLNQPVQTTSGGDSLPNVFWDVKRIVHGDRTGASAVPAASTSVLTSVVFKLGDTVTADAINLRFSTDMTPTATAPITVDLYVYRGVQ